MHLWSVYFLANGVPVPETHLLKCTNPASCIWGETDLLTIDIHGVTETSCLLSVCQEQQREGVATIHAALKHSQLPQKLGPAGLGNASDLVHPRSGNLGSSCCYILKPMWP